VEVNEPDPVILPIEDSLDLHAFAPRDVRSVVDEYLHQAVAHGFEEVRLIHGKGKGVQRATVQKLLSEHGLVAGGASPAFLPASHGSRQPSNRGYRAAGMGTGTTTSSSMPVKSSGLQV
jgi:hypothetical protein